jgi:hypothetical protein
VDLNPYVFTSSFAVATNGTQEVGDGIETGNNYQALLWTGTADSAVNLQALLPLTGTWTASSAAALDSFGDIYGIAQGTFNDVTGFFAVEWSPVPEPTTGSMLLIICAGTLLRRRKYDCPTLRK